MGELGPRVEDAFDVIYGFCMDPCGNLLVSSVEVIVEHTCGMEIIASVLCLVPKNLLSIYSEQNSSPNLNRLQVP